MPTVIRGGTGEKYELLGFEEVEAAVAYLFADMHFHTAIGTFLLAPSLWQLFDHGLLLLVGFSVEVCRKPRNRSPVYAQTQV